MRPARNRAPHQHASSRPCCASPALWLRRIASLLAVCYLAVQLIQFTRHSSLAAASSSNFLRGLEAPTTRGSGDGGVTAAAAPAGGAWGAPLQGVTDTRVGARAQPPDESQLAPAAPAPALKVASLAAPKTQAARAPVRLTAVAPHGPDRFCARSSKSSTASTLGGFVGEGGRFPIVVVTCDRADQLSRTLGALLSDVRCVLAADVLVVADGGCRGDGSAQIPSIASALGVRFHRNERPPEPGADGGARIASAYRYALDYALRTAFPGAPAVIVVEDDMAFSPDFYEYFHAVAPLFDVDTSLWLASAWHDNGFDYVVADPLALRRTRYFPGLGWLLTRRLWEDELAARWPANHWDHWMRDPLQHKGRDVVIPEIPRDYHMGIKGTFMDANTHNQYFGSIALFSDKRFTWDTPLGAAAVEGLLVTRYEARVRAALSAPTTRHLNSVAEVSALVSGEAVLWYSCPPNEFEHTSMRPLAAFFGIWHEAVRFCPR